MDGDLERVLTAAVRLYAAKAETDTPPAQAITPSAVTPTDVVVTVSDLIRAAGLNLWDVSMWFNRKESVTVEFSGRMREVNVGPASEFADPGRKLIGFDHFEVAVFKLGGEFFAYLNHCPHMGGPACPGEIIAKVEEIISPKKPPARA